MAASPWWNPASWFKRRDAAAEAREVVRALTNQGLDNGAVAVTPPLQGARKLVRAVAKVRGADPATLYFHGGELSRAAADRQHRRKAFEEAQHDA